MPELRAHLITARAAGTTTVLRAGIGAVVVALAGALAGAGPAAAASPPGSHFFLTNASGAGVADTVFTYGSPADTVLVGDWDGDGTATLGVRRGNQYFLNDGFDGSADVVVAFGTTSDAVLVGDWDGDGKDTLGVRRGNTYYLSDTIGPTASRVFSYGRPGDEVLVGNWDGRDGASLALRRGNQYYLDNDFDSSPDRVVAYGSAGDAVVVGDWDGDGADTLGVRRGNQFFLSDTIGPAADRVFSYGSATDTVLVGDWDGDADSTLGVRRPVLTIPGEGVFRVGSQVRPGLYRSGIRSGSADCSWDAYDTVEHDLAEPVAGDLISRTDGEVSVYAEVRAGDTLFTTSGCGTWSLVTGLDVAAPRALTDGRWRVGKDVLPGTWSVQVPADTACLWARTRDFRYDDDASLLDAKFEGTGEAHVVTVQVLPTDTGVASLGCGTWTRQP